MGELENPTTMPKMINYLSSLLQRVAESNDIHSLSIIPQKVSIFHGLTPPTISIPCYLERIFKYANCSPCCFVVAYVYLDRFTQRQPLLLLNSFNIHRLLITSVMVAAKFMDDLYYNNAYYAKIGGISTTEMNFLEVDFLFGLGFHLNVTPTTFHTYCSYLQREMLLLQTPLNLVVSDSNSSIIMGKSTNNKLIHSCFDEDETTSHQLHQQLAV
ncbi:cyclin-U4-1-like [Silene latifolia]|uniref:cyclin-U4-1-like n=1 Tax=Silene latifolia TaxID=37657 RepID=UPI003D781FA0